MWVRGLKLDRAQRDIMNHMSHPMWVRGLKLKRFRKHLKKYTVAPYVGAWIETLNLRSML